MTVEAAEFSSPFTLRLAPTWLLFGLLRLLILLPITAQLFLGRLIGDLFYLTFKRQRTIIQLNLKLCYPNLEEPQRHQILRGVFRSVGISFFEIGLSWWGSDRRLKRIMEIEGWEHLEQALANGKGVVLLGAHYTNMELAGRLFSLKQPLNVTYRDQGNPAFSYILHRARERHFEKLLPVNEVRPIINTLKAGKIVWLAPDQNWGKKSRVFVDFFGISAASNPGTARFCNITGAQIVPYRIIRDPKRAGYKLVFSPHIEAVPSGDLTADTARINHAIEKMIRLAPDQYMWFLKRFERRPDGEPHIYPRKLRY